MPIIRLGLFLLSAYVGIRRNNYIITTTANFMPIISPNLSTFGVFGIGVDVGVGVDGKSEVDVGVIVGSMCSWSNRRSGGRSNW